MMHARRRTAALAVLTALMLALLLVGVVTDELALVALGGMGACLTDLAVHRHLTAAVPKQVKVLRGELHPRLLLSQLLVVAYLLRSDALSSQGEAVVLVAVVVAQGLRMVFSALLIAESHLRPGRAQVRGLPAAEPVVSHRPRLLSDSGLVVMGLATALLPASLGWTLLSQSFVLVAPAAVAGALIGLAVLAAVAPAVLRLARLPHGQRQVRGVHEAVLRHGPEVVLYSNGGIGDVHWLTPWLDVLERLDRPALIMLRQPGTVETLPPTTTPVVCLPEAGDVHAFAMPTARVALFVANGPENLRLLRHSTLRSAFIGHGDSDKASSAHRATRLYDEVWVAGPAARQRYLAADVGLVPERLQVVGRPQVSRVDRSSSGRMPWPCTVLYAPTWEGVGLDPYESSVARSGRQVVEVLLTLPGTRVIFRPHPATGRHDAAAARAAREITVLLAKAGPQHQAVVGGGVDLYALFNRVDALVADVSGVVTDFLASEKPYFVVNTRETPESEFHRRNPSTGAAYLVGPDAEGLAAGLCDAHTADSLRPSRLVLREHLLGPSTEDPLQLFRDAVDRLAAQEVSTVG